jgi:peptidoglycan/xylan/chitin deacetylase (PgdA/CDA1 family)
LPTSTRRWPPRQACADERPGVTTLTAANVKLVLCYHALSEDWPATLSTTPALLHWHLRRLLGRGFHARGFTDTVLASDGQRTMAVTFDDAFRSVRTLGVPILQQLGVPGTVFVPTDHVGGTPMRWPGIDAWTGGPHERELVGCTWEELAELADTGWEIGSHTCSHRRLTTLSEHEVRAELVDSKAECEDRLGRRCRSLAYPYGDHDERIVRATRRAGYSAAGTLPGRFEAVDVMQYPRVFVSRADTRLRFAVKTAALTLLARQSALWNLVNRGRMLTSR